MILEPAKKRRPSEDDSFIGIRVGVLLLLAFLLFGVLGFRLWYMQILSGSLYVASATSNRSLTVMVEAPRGVIYDRKGKVLVENRGGLSVGLLAMDMPDPEKNAFEFDQEISSLTKLLGISKGDVLTAYKTATRDPYVTYMLQEDVPENTVVAYLKEHGADFPGVVVQTAFLRQYPLRALAAHVLGYVGEISSNDIGQQEFLALKAGAHVGLDGVERTYDSYLRGTDGWKTVEVDAAGNPKQIIDDYPAVAGNNLVLTIDSDLQKAAEDALVEGIQRAHASGFDKAAGGAVVAMDPQTGEILAMASYPNYDPSVWVGGISNTDFQELNDDPNKPLFDRALDGLYPAGSTFKPFVASVALNTGVITTNTIFNCTGSFTLKGQTSSQTWKDSGGAHGDVNVVQAIEQSCDVFFYNVGWLMYQQQGAQLQDGLRSFGFGIKTGTGIDLPGETDKTRVPDLTWKRATGQTAEEQLWKPGDEINLAIGQGDLLVTPLQLAVACSAIANGGTVWVPHVGLEITDASGRIIRPIQNEVRNKLDISDTILKAVRRGMRLVTSDPTGTAYDAFRGFPVAVGGKTGTAQKKPDDDYALFMGYAPADGMTAPQIVVVAIIEQGGKGAGVAAPVVRRVMQAYFGKGQGSAASISNPKE